MSIAVTPTGPLSLPLFHLREMLADSPAFQAFVNAANAAEARERIHYSALPAQYGETYTVEELNELRPFAMIGIPSEESYEMTTIAGGGPFNWTDEGQIILYLEWDVADAFQRDRAAADVDAMNTIGAILSEIQDRSGLAGFLCIDRIRLSAIFRTKTEEHNTQGDAYMVELTLNWNGGRSGE